MLLREIQMEAGPLRKVSAFCVRLLTILLNPAFTDTHSRYSSSKKLISCKGLSGRKKFYFFGPALTSPNSSPPQPQIQQRKHLISPQPESPLLRPSGLEPPEQSEAADEHPGPSALICKKADRSGLTGPRLRDTGVTTLPRRSL